MIVNRILSEGSHGKNKKSLQDKNCRLFYMERNCPVREILLETFVSNANGKSDDLGM